MCAAVLVSPKTHDLNQSQVSETDMEEKVITSEQLVRELLKQIVAEIDFQYEADQLEHKRYLVKKKQ